MVAQNTRTYNHTRSNFQKQNHTNIKHTNLYLFLSPLLPWIILPTLDDNTRQTDFTESAVTTQTTTTTAKKHPLPTTVT
jgi:hypothetical protein